MISIKEQEPAFGDIWFFGVGINTYDHYKCLNNAILDIKTIEGRLKTEYFPNLRSNVIEDANLEDIIAYFDYLRENIKVMDRLIIYFAGHGYKDNESQRGFWIPKDAKKENRGLYIHNSVVIEYLEDIKAYHILLIVDACFAGTIAPSRTVEYEVAQESKKSRWLLASGHDDEKVSDGLPGENSPFAKALTEFFDAGDEVFGINKLCNQVARIAYRLTSNQRVRFAELNIRGNEGGQLVFRRVCKEDQMFKDCVDHKNRIYCQKYFDAFPEGKHSKNVIQIFLEIENKENQLFKGCKSLAQLYKFKFDHPDRVDLVKKAERKMNRLKQQPPKDLGVVKRKQNIDEPELIFVAADSSNKLIEVGFYICKYPITYEEYSIYCTKNKKIEPMKEYNEENLPIVKVTFFDAINYAEWLSKITGGRFRLPTESEWKFAAIGGNLSQNFLYSGSNNPSEVANYYDCSTSRKRLEPVKSDRLLNELGIADMSGNVWEWCADNFDDLKMVIKGGSWMSNSKDALITNSLGQDPNEATDDIGFRLVTSDKQKKDKL